MSNSPGQYTPEAINHVFAHLHPQDVEQFYTSYRQWLRQYLLADLHAQVSTLRQQILVNNLLMQQSHPSPIALATLARLQSNGVTDLDLLDRMLERGEAWLDNTMLQLEYCEQFDFIRGNYTEWCEHALEGAYDWIDSMHKVQTANNTNNVGSTDNASSTAVVASAPNTPTHTQTGETLNEATEEVFLQKLMSEEDASLIDTAPEIAIVTPASQEETSFPLVDQETAQMQATDPNPVLQATQHSPEFHTPGYLAAPGDSHQNAPIPIQEEDTIDNSSFEDTIPTKAIVQSTGQDQVAAPIQLDETNAAPSLTATAPVEHDETTSHTLAGTTNASDSTSQISIEEPVEPAELPVSTTPANISNAPVSEKILSPMTGSTALAAANTEATTTAAETSPDEVATPALEDATSSLTPAATPTKEISNAPNSSNSPIIPAIPVAELSPSKDTKPAAGAAEQFYTSDDTSWHSEGPSPTETKNASLTIPANQASQTSQDAEQKSTQPTSTNISPEHAPSSAPSPTTKSPRKANFLQILFRVFFSRKPKKP